MHYFDCSLSLSCPSSDSNSCCLSVASLGYYMYRVLITCATITCVTDRDVSRFNPDTHKNIYNFFYFLFFFNLNITTQLESLNFRDKILYYMMGGLELISIYLLLSIWRRKNSPKIKFILYMRGFHFFF